MIRSTVLESHSGCCGENRLEGRTVQPRRSHRRWLVNCGADETWPGARSVLKVEQIGVTDRLGVKREERQEPPSALGLSSWAGGGPLLCWRSIRKAQIWVRGEIGSSAWDTLRWRFPLGI